MRNSEFLEVASCLEMLYEVSPSLKVMSYVSFMNQTLIGQYGNIRNKL